MRLPLLSAVAKVLDSVVTCVPRKSRDWRRDTILARVHPNLCGRWEPPPEPMSPTPAIPRNKPRSASLELSYIVDQMDVALLAYESAANAIAGDLPYLTNLPSIRHPEYPNRDRIDNNYRHTFGNYGSFLQHGRGTFDEYGNPTCLTFGVAYGAVDCLVPGHQWADWIDNSDDILNRQPVFEVNNKPFDTYEHYLDTTTPDKVDALKSACITRLMYVMVHAYMMGYDSYVALVYGKNPGEFWDPIIKKAYELAIKYIVTHLPESKSPRQFPLHVIKIIHFCAVIHDLSVEEKRSMDVAITKFVHPDAYADVEPCTFFCRTSFTSKRFWSSRGGKPYLVEFTIRQYAGGLQHIPLRKLGKYIDVPPSIRRKIESEMEDIVNNANDDLKNCPHRRRFTSNSERRHISIMPNTTLASIRNETRPLGIIIKKAVTPFTPDDVTLVDMQRWNGVKSALARKKTAAKRKADGISTAPPQQVSSQPRARKKRTCEVHGCSNWVQCRGVCVKHGAEKSKCSVDGCTNKVVKGGVCVKHGAEKPRCSVDGCSNWVQCRGVCVKHGAEKSKCSVDGCTNKVVKGGVCVKHGANK